MPTDRKEWLIETRGNGEVLNITDPVAKMIQEGTLESGVATVFVVGSTAAITTTEFEPGLANHDIKNAMEKIAPEDGDYIHEQTWHDDNGHSHVRATLMGPSLAVPFCERRLDLGTWQQIVLIDFDTRSRQRRIIVQMVG